MKKTGTAVKWFAGLAATTALISAASMAPAQAKDTGWDKPIHSSSNTSRDTGWDSP